MADPVEDGVRSSAPWKQTVRSPIAQAMISPSSRRRCARGAHLAAGADERLPVGRRRNAAEQETSTAPEELATFGVVLADGEGVDPGAMAEEARGEDARVVKHQAIAGVKELRKVAKGAVFPAALRAMDHQHPRGGAIGERLLGNQLVGQVEIEFGKVHSELL